MFSAEEVELLGKMFDKSSVLTWCCDLKFTIK